VALDATGLEDRPDIAIENDTIFGGRRQDACLLRGCGCGKNVHGSRRKADANHLEEELHLGKVNVR